jgi:uncharacterized membrane protein
MTLEPMLSAGLAIQIHATAAIGAFFLGTIQMVGIKGTNLHRKLGWAWIILMATVAITTAWIHEIKLWGQWSPIHLLSIVVLVQLTLAVIAARRRNIRAHKRLMTGLFTGALILAGFFTLMPGRIFGRMIFG